MIPSGDTVRRPAQSRPSVGRGQWTWLRDELPREAVSKAGVSSRGVDGELTALESQLATRPSCEASVRRAGAARDAAQARCEDLPRGRTAGESPQSAAHDASPMSRVRVAGVESGFEMSELRRNSKRRWRTQPAVAERRARPLFPAIGV
jgi:hypothetical protein